MDDTDAAVARPSDRRLAGWKEIAGHFGKAVRTVQRWESELSLPVHRMQTGRGDTVYALVSELEAWQRSLDITRLDNGADANEPVLPAEPGSAAGTPARSRAALVAIGFAGVLLLVAGAFLVARQLPFLFAPASQPSELRLDFDTLSAYDASGRQLWSYRAQGELESPRYRWPGRGVPAGRPLAAIHDLDGDGKREVIVLERQRDATRPGFLVCLDARGRTRFRLPAPKHWVSFGSDRYGPPWVAHNLFVTGEPGRSALWVAWTHLASGNFPCLLQRVSVEGQVESEYWSAGHIETVAEGVVRGRRVIFVGAANNDHRAGGLAVFDERNVRGAAPAETEEKTCHGCPAGSPLAFLVFPRMELSRLVEGFPTVVNVLQQEGGLLRVTVVHVGSHSGEALIGCVYYDLSPELQPMRAEVGANYVAGHRLLEAAGTIDHPFGDRDRAEAWPVLSWAGGNAFVTRTGTTDR